MVFNNSRTLPPGYCIDWKIHRWTESLDILLDCLNCKETSSDTHIAGTQPPSPCLVKLENVI